MNQTYPFGNSPYTTWRNAYDQLEIVTSTGDHFVQQPDDSLPTEGDWYFNFVSDELYRVAWQDNDTIGYVDDNDQSTHTDALSDWETLLNNEILYPVEPASNATPD